MHLSALLFAAAAMGIATLVPTVAGAEPPKPAVGDPLSRLPQWCSDDPVYVRAALARDARDLRLASPRLRNDVDIVLAAVEHDGAVFAFASPRLRADRATIYRAIALRPEVVATLDAATLQDRTLWAGAVRFNPDVLPWLPARALDDDETLLTSVRWGVKREGFGLFRRFPWKLFVDRRDVIVAAVGADGRLLANLTGAQRADPDIVDAAVANDPAAIRFADPAVAADPSFVSRAARRNGRVLLYAPALADGLVGDADNSWKGWCGEHHDDALCTAPLLDLAEAAFVEGLTAEATAAAGASSVARLPPSPCAPGVSIASCADVAFGHGVLVVSGPYLVHIAPTYPEPLPGWPVALVVTTAKRSDDGLHFLATKPVAGHFVRGLAAMQPRATTLRARSFEVRDDDGTVDFGAAGGRGNRTWSSSVRLTSTPQVLCADHVVLPLGRLLDVVTAAGGDGSWSIVFRYRLPCAALWIVPATAARPGGYRAFLDHPVYAEEQPYGDGDGPFIDDVRVRRFGSVTLQEEGATPYGRSCSFTAGKTRRLTVSSSYGCGVQFAGDLNADGIADFIVHTGAESCEADTLWLSTTTGWVEAAGRQGCC